MIYLRVNVFCTVIFEFFYVFVRLVVLHTVIKVERIDFTEI